MTAYGCDFCAGSGCFRCTPGGVLTQQLKAECEQEAARDFLREHFGRGPGGHEIRAPQSLEELTAVVVLALEHGAKRGQGEATAAHDPMARFAHLEV